MLDSNIIIKKALVKIEMIRSATGKKQRRMNEFVGCELSKTGFPHVHTFPKRFSISSVNKRHEPKVQFESILMCCVHRAHWPKQVNRVQGARDC